MQSKIPNDYNIQTGVETYTDVAAGQNTSSRVDLTGFSNQPLLSIALDADSALTETSCAIRNISKDKFNICVRNGGSSATTIKVRWFALGR